MPTRTTVNARAIMALHPAPVGNPDRCGTRTPEPGTRYPVKTGYHCTRHPDCYPMLGVRTRQGTPRADRLDRAGTRPVRPHP